jgi:hypothetical protein
MSNTLCKRIGAAIIASLYNKQESHYIKIELPELTIEYNKGTERILNKLFTEYNSQVMVTLKQNLREEINFTCIVNMEIFNACAKLTAYKIDVYKAKSDFNWNNIECVELWINNNQIMDLYRNNIQLNCTYIITYNLVNAKILKHVFPKLAAIRFLHLIDNPTIIFDSTIANDYIVHLSYSNEIMFSPTNKNIHVIKSILLPYEHLCSKDNYKDFSDNAIIINELCTYRIRPDAVRKIIYNNDIICYKFNNSIDLKIMNKFLSMN